jgi:hypothetical protein
MRFSHSHSENSVGFLIMKEISFFRNASKSEHESIMVLMIIITEINLIFNHKSFIAGAFHVALVKFTFLIICTMTSSVLAAIKGEFGCAFIEVVQIINMISACRIIFIFVAVVFARNSSNTTTCIYN